MSVINILMQLRKVCNHPNLFDPRPIQSPFITQPIVFRTASLVQDALEVPPLKVSIIGNKDVFNVMRRQTIAWNINDDSGILKTLLNPLVNFH